jgi:hypothetical protein
MKFDLISGTCAISTMGNAGSGRLNPKKGVKAIGVKEYIMQALIAAQRVTFEIR